MLLLAAIPRPLSQTALYDEVHDTVLRYPATANTFKKKDATSDSSHGIKPMPAISHIELKFPKPARRERPT